MGAAKKQRNRQAPRLRFEEDQGVLIRFKTSRIHFIQTSRVYDISESGISFLCSKRLAPLVGSIIKLEVAPFGSLQMACMGRVVRVEFPTESSPWARFPNTVKVGIEFHEMPPPYAKALSKCIKEAFRRSRTPYKNQAIEVGPRVSLDFRWFFERGWTYLAGLALTAVGALLIYWIITTIQANHSTTQAPWASGFFDKVINGN